MNGKEDLAAGNFGTAEGRALDHCPGIGEDYEDLLAGLIRKK
jgi:hypothetical protein